MKAKALATCEVRGPAGKTHWKNDVKLMEFPCATSNYGVAPGEQHTARRLPFGSERHITCNATEELKFDGYRALAIKSGGRVQLRSRNDNDFSARYPGIAKALAPMPDETVIDGEVVALDADGRPSFNMLQNYGSAGAPLHFFIFDVLILKGRDVMGEPVMKRRELIEKHILPKLADPIRYSPILEGSLSDLILSVKAQGLEGIVAKRRDSRYETWAALRGMDEDAGERRSGARHRRVHTVAQKFRCAGDRLL